MDECKCGATPEIVGNSLCVTCDYEERKAWADKQCSPAFVIFEGCCPDCGGELEDKNQGGFYYAESHYKWFEFTCTNCKKVAYVEQTEGGDWASNYG